LLGIVPTIGSKSVRSPAFLSDVPTPAFQHMVEVGLVFGIEMRHILARFRDYHFRYDTVLTEAKALHDPMTGEKRVAYSFRHYFATMLLGQGVPIAVVADWLGTSSAMIERHYKDAITGEQAHLLSGGALRRQQRWQQQVASCRPSRGRPNGRSETICHPARVVEVRSAHGRDSHTHCPACADGP
jgi:Phage integrase family